MSEPETGNGTTVSFLGVEYKLNSMDTAPMNTAILVLLSKESLHSEWHTATLHKNVSFVGHQFAFDCPKMIGWLPLPTAKPIPIGEVE